MIQEKLKYGHSVRLQFDIPKVDLKEEEITIEVDKDLVLSHNLNSSERKKINLNIKPNMNITIVEEFKGETQLSDFSTKILIGENAKVNYQSRQELSNNSTLIQNNLFNLETNAKLKLLNVILGCKQLKHKTTVSLDGEGAECNNNVAYLSKEEQKFIIETSNIHNAKHTSSNMLTKGVLDGKSKVVNTGVVRIEPHAWGSNGYQTGNHLLLSKTAEINPIPELEIGNHDVKCSHGVTVSRINDEKMFYFRSRGIPKEQAKIMFVKGFLSSAMNSLEQKKQEEILDQVNWK